MHRDGQHTAARNTPRDQRGRMGRDTHRGWRAPRSQASSPQPWHKDPTWVAEGMRRERTHLRACRRPGRADAATRERILGSGPHMSVACVRRDERTIEESSSMCIAPWAENLIFVAPHYIMTSVRLTREQHINLIIPIQTCQYIIIFYFS